MTTRWERLAGDTGVFALKVAFASDPDEGRGIDPEVGASWGSFQIWVRGRNLCAHREEGEHLDSVHWYLLPLLEWFARNWDPLLHEERLPVRNAAGTAWESLHATRFPSAAVEDDERKASEWASAWQAWWSRHALRAASEGGLFPDIVFRRLRDRIELSWRSVQTAGMPGHYRFTESERGSADLSPREVAGPLHDVLTDAARYLSSLMPDSERIRVLTESLEALGADGEAQVGTRERRLAWLAGLGAVEHDMWAGWRRAVKGLSTPDEKPRRAVLETVETPLVVTGSCHAALMFGSLAPDVTEQDVRTLARAMIGHYAPEGEPDEIRELCRAEPIEESAAQPWAQGYELAEEVHQHFNGNFERGDFVNMDGILAAFGIRPEKLELSDPGVRGVAIAGPQHRPGILVNARHDSNGEEAGCRFTLAHELCHLLFDRKKGRRLAVASGPWAPCAIEQRANAFAAMLLMPVSIVRRAVEAFEPVATKEGVEGVVKRLHVGRRAVLFHLMNLGFIDETDRQRLEDPVAPPA